MVESNYYKPKKFIFHIFHYKQRSAEIKGIKQNIKRCSLRLPELDGLPIN